MFAGIDCARDWPPSGMSSARWLRVPPRRVLIGDLTATQEGVYFAPLLCAPFPVGGDPLPHVVCWRGRLYLEDGHHRVIRAVLDGGRDIEARVLVIATVQGGQ